MCCVSRVNLSWPRRNYVYESECDESEKSLFVNGNGWVNNFMRRNGFSLHCKITTEHQDLERLIDKLILYILYAHRPSVKYKYPPSI